jgi:ADP-heptose:LPS heptosyltransferase
MSDIILAPFSNSAIRDWPAEHYRDLIGLLLEDPEITGMIRLIGTAGHRLGVCEIVRPHPADRVTNECGRLAWSEVLATLRTAACVVGNNSGIPHVSGHYGTPTVCIFGGSHQRLEWRPRGRNTIVLSRVIACSPCQLDHGNSSPFGKACLWEIEPREVCDAVRLARAGRH